MRLLLVSFLFFLAVDLAVYFLFHDDLENRLDRGAQKFMVTTESLGELQREIILRR